MRYQIEELKRLLKKELAGTLTAEEANFLERMRPLFDPQEWNEWRIDAALDLPESGDALEQAATERMLDQAKEKVDKPALHRRLGRPRGGRNPGRRMSRAVAGVAACVVIGVLWQLWWIYTPTFVLDDLQRCRDTAPEAELSLSSSQAQVIYWRADEEVKLQELPGDSLRVGPVLIQWLDDGRYVISLTGDVPTDPHFSSGDWDSQGRIRISFRTGAYQHIAVSLPNGTVTRLDAGSRLDYLLETPTMPDNLSDRQWREWIGLHGQALIRIPERDGTSSLLVQTVHAWLEGRSGEFVLRVTPDEVRGTVQSGSLLLNAHSDPDRRVLANAGTQVRLCKVCNEQRKVVDEWSLKKVGKDEIAQSLTWTKGVREYSNVPMREFVSDMARWYGIRFEDINCIPAKVKVNVTMCYRSDPAELIEFIRNSGIPVIEHKLYYSFCNPATQQSQDQHQQL